MVVGFLETGGRSGTIADVLRGEDSGSRPSAEVAKRQTQWTQNPPWVTTWGFKSPPRHQRDSERSGDISEIARDGQSSALGVNLRLGHTGRRSRRQLYHRHFGPEGARVSITLASRNQDNLKLPLKIMVRVFAELEMRVRRDIRLPVWQEWGTHIGCPIHYSAFSSHTIIGH